MPAKLPPAEDQEALRRQAFAMIFDLLIGVAEHAEDKGNLSIIDKPDQARKTEPRGQD